MTDILVGNERCKAVSNLLFTLCAALIAGSALRTWESGRPDLAAATWMFVSSVLAFFGWQMLGLLVAEELG